METLLRIQDIEKYYGSKSYITKAVDHISFEVQKGEFLGIMGASGSGKSTLLNCISTIDRVTSGHIYLEDTDITELKDKKMAVFRQENTGSVGKWIFTERGRDGCNLYNHLWNQFGVDEICIKKGECNGNHSVPVDGGRRCSDWLWIFT